MTSTTRIPRDSALELTIQTGSIDTSNADCDKHPHDFRLNWNKTLDKGDVFVGDDVALDGRLEIRE